MHTPEALFQKLTAEIGSFVMEGMAPVKEVLPVRGFFPGTYGFWPEVSERSRFPRRWFVLAHDFGTVGDWLGTDRKHGEAENGATWSNLLDLLGRVKPIPICPEDCFFSNAVIALRDSRTNTGGQPGLRTEKARNTWAACLRIQIDAVRPDGLIVLGAPAWRVVRTAYPDAGLPVSFSEFDAENRRRPVRIKTEDRELQAILLYHPSLRKPNLKRSKARTDGYELELLGKLSWG